MTIIVEEQNPKYKTTLFDDLELGEVFEYDDGLDSHLYMKLRSVESHGYPMNAVKLKDGDLFHFDTVTICNKVNATLSFRKLREGEDA